MIGNRGKNSNLKNLFGLKITIISIVCLLFGLSCASLFVFNQKQTKNVNAVSVETNSLNQIDDSTLILKWDKKLNQNKSTKMLALGSDVSMSPDGAVSEYNFSGQESLPSPIPAGTTIAISGQSLVFTISGTTYTVTAIMNSGYKFDGFQLGYINGTTYNYYNNSNTEPLTSGSVTTEQLDPQYSGELFFQVAWSYEEYGLDLFYLQNNGNYMDFIHGLKDGYDGSVFNHYVNWRNNDVKYTNELNKFVSLSLSPNKKPNDSAIFKGWIFDLKVAGNEGYSVVEDDSNKTINVTATKDSKPINLIFKYSETFVDLSGSKNYYVTDVYGCGDLVQGGAPQSSTKPIIYAGWTNQYKFIINSGDSNWSTAELPNDVEYEDLYGAHSSNTSADFTKTTLTIANVEYNYDFEFMDDQMSSDGSVFYTNDWFDGGAFSCRPQNSNRAYYYIFNYGHYITSYTIKFGNGKYVYLNDNTWSVITSNTPISFNADQTNSNTTLNKIAAYLDTICQGVINIPDVEITPSWAEQEFNVVANIEKDGKEISESVVYSSDSTISTKLKIGYMYELKLDESLTPERVSENLQSDGRSLVAYESGAFRIATAGVWNYCYGVSSIYSYESGTYAVNVTPKYLDNVYKVTLNNPSSYILESDYKFATSVNNSTYTAEVYDYKTNPLDKYEFKNYFTWNGTGDAKPIDEYIVQLNTYITNWENLTNRKRNDASNALKYVYYTNGTFSSDTSLKDTTSETSLYVYLVNNEEISNVLPTFAHDYKKLIFWTSTIKDENEENITLAFTTKNYSTDWSNEITGNSYEDKTIWLREYDTTFSPYYLHRLDLYYESYKSTDEEFKNPEYAKQKSNWYGKHTPNLIGDDVTTIKPETVFGYWMFNADVASNAGWTVGDLDTSNADSNKGIIGTIAISNGSVSLKMTVIGKNPFRNYYYITQLQGTGVVEQDADNPFITAKFSKLYDLTIEHNGTEWNNLGLDDETLDGLRGVYHNKNLGGSGNYGGEISFKDEENGKLFTKFNIAHSDNYKYAFMSSEVNDETGLSFYHRNDFRTVGNVSYVLRELDDEDSKYSYYYIYNYGYYISGWYLRLDDTHWLNVDGNGNWELLVYEQLVDIDKLADTNFATLATFAEQADEYFAYEMGGKAITIYPKWEAVSVKASYTYTLEDETVEKEIVSKIKFGSEYTANGVAAPSGKSLFAYRYNDNEENPLMISYVSNGSYSGKWNYLNIGSGEYKYAPKTPIGAETTIGAGTYTLAVDPVYVDNIYKVTLNDVKLTSEDTYTLTKDCGYAFNSKKGSYGTQTQTGYFSFLDSYLQGGSGYVFEYYSSSYALMDDYIKELLTCKNAYQAGIDGDGTNDFDIFRKVYYTTDPTSIKCEISTTKIAYDTLTCESAPTFSIYLANAQQTGYMPAFEKPYYALIFWKNDNTSTSGEQYAYKTQLYDPNMHKDELDDYAIHGDYKDIATGKEIWYLSDGNIGGTTVSFTSHYFRKYYQLDIQTLFESKIDRRGYIHVEINDSVYAVDKTVDDCGGEYIVVAYYNNTAKKYVMAIYDASTYTSSLTKLTNINDVLMNENNLIPNITENSLKFNVKENEYAYLKLYEGCDISFNIKDQSQDPEAMHSKNFDEMIGYKFDSGTGISQLSDEVNKPLFTEIKSYSPSTEADDVVNNGFKKADEIVTIGYENGEVITIKVPFVKIKYTITFQLDDLTSGEYQVHANSAVSGWQKNSYELSNRLVDDSISVEYFAFAGYALQENAFVITNNANSSAVLQGYDESTGDISQNYLLSTNGTNMNAAWLRTFFYSDKDYSVDKIYNYNSNDKSNFSLITIQTEPIEFNVGYIVYESNDSVGEWKLLKTDITLPDHPVIGHEQTTFKFYKHQGTGMFYWWGQYLLTQDMSHPSKFWYYQHSEIIGEGENSEEVLTNYALLSSRMYFPTNYKTTRDNHYITYEFLLRNCPAYGFSVNVNILSDMINNYEVGKIVPSTNRQIYIMLEVRELITIEMKVKTADNDTNSTTRTTTLTNGTNNNASITISSGANIDAGYYVPITGASVKVYTYNGLNNTVKSVFDANRYADVEYYLNGSMKALTTSTFVVENSSVLEIKYIPATLKIEVAYTQDGVAKSKDSILPYMTDNSPLLTGEVVVGDTFAYSISALHNDYDVSVKINSSIMPSILTIPASWTYEVTDNDFSFGRILILAELTLKDNSKINVAYQLMDASKKAVDDNYGVLSVFENSTLKVEKQAEAKGVTIIVDRSVYVKPELNAGYELVEVKYNTNDAKPIGDFEFDSNYGYKIISNYDPDNNSGTYLIVVDKIDISAELDTTGLQASYYIDGKTKLTNLYVGKEISLTCDEIPGERLGCFYYTYGPAGSETTVYLTADGTETGTPQTTFKITSDVIEKCGTTIKFGVVAVKRYKFDLVVEGSEYLEENSLKLVYSSTGTNYELGTYVDTGTQIKVSAKTLVFEKYKINFNSKTVDELIDEVITIDKNISLTLKVVPNTYMINVKENVYETLTEVQGNNPKPETQGVNGISPELRLNQKYNIASTITINRLVNDRELYAMYLSGNEGENITVIFENNGYTAYLNYGETNQEEIQLSHAVYNLSIQISADGKVVRLTYTPKDNLGITLDYKMYKLISA